LKEVAVVEEEDYVTGQDERFTEDGEKQHVPSGTQWEGALRCAANKHQGRPSGCEERDSYRRSNERGPRRRVGMLLSWRQREHRRNVSREKKEELRETASNEGPHQPWNDGGDRAAPTAVRDECDRMSGGLKGIGWFGHV
jgi:hypothetical protein